ncbi:MAG: type II secretion system F family protein, partial [Planctomycetaceae bacterium]|nr:type II secretion system F family protein [Planctomycetaceae bacterium]
MTQHTPSDGHQPGPSSRSTESAFESIATLVTAGLPLESGLRALSEEVPSRRLRRAMRQMSDELASGRTPDEVFSHQRKGLPHYLAGLVRAGVQTGRLGEFLEQFLVSVRRRRQATGSFWRMMAYPLFLIPVVLLVGTGVMGVIVPQFKEIFDNFGVELPAMTMLLLSLSSRPFVIGMGVAIPLFVILVLAVLVLGPYVPGHAIRLRL